MEKRFFLSSQILVLLMCLLPSCTQQEPLKDENVLQIKNVGLREGVFIRRYKLTSYYGKQQVYTPEILKRFIKEKLESNYFFIADAYELGYHKENIIQQNIKDFRVNLIAANHPFNYESFNISKKALRGFYQKKSVLYDIDFVQANSYSMADSMYKFLLAGNKLPSSEMRDALIFPRFQQFNDLTYGQMLHPEVFVKLIELKEGQVCKPVFTYPKWAIIRLNNIRKNTRLQSYDEMENELIKQMHVLIKFENQKQLMNDLSKKYPVSVNNEHYQSMISAFRFDQDQGWIDKNKIVAPDLNDTFLNINNDEISLSNFILIFNKSMQFIQSPEITKEDLNMFVENYISQNLLYLDALEKGADQDVLIKDKLANKEHRFLLTKFLNDEIAQKVIVTDADARQHYNNNRSKWQSEYKEVEKSVRHDLKTKRLYERKQELTDKLQKKYNVRYNEPLLKKLAEQLTAEKKRTSREITGQ